MSVAHLPSWGAGHIFLCWCWYYAMYINGSWCPQGPRPSLLRAAPSLSICCLHGGQAWSTGTLGARREGAREIPNSVLQNCKSEEAQAHCQAQGGTAEQGRHRCSTVQPPVAQVTLAALYDLGTTADLALLAVVGGA